MEHHHRWRLGIITTTLHRGGWCWLALFFDDLLEEKGGELRAYRKVVDAFAKTTFSSLSLADVKLVNSKSKLPQTIGTLITTPSKGFVRAHFTNNFVNGIFLKDMLLLRSA